MMVNHLSVMEWAKAVRMWRHGNDTHRIAEALNCREALIANKLHVYREKWRGVELSYSRPHDAA